MVAHYRPSMIGLATRTISLPIVTIALYTFASCGLTMYPRSRLGDKKIKEGFENGSKIDGTP